MSGLKILSTRGKQAGVSSLCVERALADADMPLVLNPPKVAVDGESAVKRLRSRHHQLARLLAQGVEQNEICLITGYDPSRISILKGDPAFQDLTAYYAGQVNQSFVDVHERMAQLGINALEELQTRLEEEPDKVSFGQLMDVVDMTLGPKATMAAKPSGTAVSLNVVFGGPPDATPTVTIDGVSDAQ